MANEYRSLVIHQGVQKRIPDGQALDVGSVGIVAMNDEVVQKLQIGHADNVNEKPIELLGSAHFKKNVKIDGELTVVGDTSIVDTLVSQTIFEQNVTFGDNAADWMKVIGIADFDGSIDADVSKLSAYSSGGILLHTGMAAVPALEPTDLSIQVQADDDINLRSGGAASFKAAQGTLAIDAEAGQLDLDGATVDMMSDGVLGITAAGQMTVNAQGGLDENVTGAHTFDASSSVETLANTKTINALGSISLSADDDSSFKTTSGFLAIDAEAGQLDLDGNTGVTIDSATGGVSIDAAAASNFSTSAGDLAVSAAALLDLDGANVEIDASGYVSVEAAGNSDFTVTGENKQLLLTSTGVGGLLSASATQTASIRGGSLVQAFTDTAADATRAQLKLDSVGESILWSKQDQNLALKAQGTGQLSADGKDVFATAGAGYMQLQSGSPTAAAQPTQAAGNIVLWADQDLRAAVDNAIDLKSVDASAWEVSNGDLDLKATAKKLRLSTGAHAPVQTEADLDIVLAADNNVIADADNMFFLRSGSEFKAESAALMEVKAAGLMTLDADAGMSMDIEGDLNITVDPLDASGGDFSLDVSRDILKQVGGQVSIFAGNDDEGYFHVAAGKRAADVWAAPNPGEIELRAQMDMRLRAAGDLRMEVGSTKDVILDDSSAGVFDENNEVGHARIRNVKDPTHAQDAVTKKYMEENGGGTVKLIAFEALAKGDLVALESTAGKVQKADAASNDYLFGIATHAADADGEILVRMLGKFDLGAAHGQTPGTPFYMDANGAASATAPSAEGSSVQRAGLYLAGNEVLMLIGEPVIL